MAKLLFRFLHIGTYQFMTPNSQDKPPGSGQNSLSCRCESERTISPPHFTAPHSVGTQIPRTAAAGVGGRASLLKPQRVPIRFGTQIPEPLPWEWEDELPPSTTAGPYSVGMPIPRTAAVGVGGRASLLKPWRVPTWSGRKFPELPLWEWEDELPSSNHDGPLLSSGCKFPNCRQGSGRMRFPPQTTAAPYSVGMQIPHTTTMEVGGRASLLKPRQVLTRLRTQIPKPPPWEWEDDFPSSNHSGSILNSGCLSLNC